MRKPYLQLRSVVVLFLVSVMGLFLQSAQATPIITAVVETGGDNEPTDTITAKWSGATWPVTVAGEPVPGAVVGQNYAAGKFGFYVPCYVDRAHRYCDPTDTLKIPSYLNSGEYILSGNDNRDNAGYMLDVTIARDAIVYLLIDNRLGDANGANPPTLGATSMQWVLDQGWTAVRTGNNRTGDITIPDEVGIDESADTTINNWFSVYSKRIGAGTFRLFQADNAGQNMYGVVVQPAPKAQLAVGLNFAADEPPNVGSPIAAGAVAGAVPQANWNNLSGANGSSSTIVADAAGASTPTPISVTWACPNTWSSTGRGEENNGFAAGGDRALLTGYLDTGNSASTIATVTVSGIPAEFTSGGYDVLVYCIGGVAGRGGAYTINGETKYGDAPANPAAHVEDPGLTVTDTGTYVRFRGQYGASFTLTASADAALPNVNFRAPINGIQIVRNSDANAGEVRGFLSKVRYDNIGTSVNVVDLFNNPKYINDQADLRCLRTDFSANDANECNNCGLVVRGYFIPRETGPHTFYLSADDGAALLMSSDESPANKVQIAREPTWAGRRNYIGDADGGGRGDPPVNRSAPIMLVRGAKYYIEGAVKEGGGGDNLDVAVQGPSDPAVQDGDRPIYGARIATIVDLTGSSLVITTQPVDARVPEGNTATFTVAVNAVAPSCGASTLYQWRRNGVDIPGANGPTLTFGPVTPDLHNTKYDVIVTIPGVTRVSAQANLEVLGRECLQVVRAAASGNTSVAVEFSTFLSSENSTTDPFNYTLQSSGGASINILSVAAAASGKSVILTTDPLEENTTYTVTAANVKSIVGSDLCAAPTNSATFRSWVTMAACNGVVMETFNTVGRNPIDNLLTAQPNYPNNPRERFLIAGFDSRMAYADDSHEDYAARLRGVFIPPVSGNWIFHMRSDDPGRLYFNPTGPSEAGKIRVADQPGCCNGFPAGGAQVSQPFPLTAGLAYYVELLYWEYGGGDYGQAAVQLQGGPAPTEANLKGALVGAGLAPAGIGGPVNITTQPANQTVFANANVSFSVVASNPNNLPLCYQWQRDGTDIAGANQATYSFGPVSVSDNNAVFTVKVGVIGTEVTSAAARLTVNEDLVKPTVESVSGDYDLTKVIVRFSELVTPQTAGDEFGYAVSGGASITDATLGADGRTATLTLDAALTPDTQYTLTVSGVTDLSGNAMDTANVPFRTLAIRRGYTLDEIYLGLSSSTVAISDLTGSPKYPSSPDIRRYKGTAELNTFDEFEGYGARLSGWIKPPVSGNYNFFMSSDDNGELWLSTDQSPANKVLIAKEPVWNGRRDWLGTARRNPTAPENRSSTLFPGGIPLTAGQLYYFEALVKEGGGGDNLAFTWQIPGDPVPESGSAALSGVYMYSLVDPSGEAISITQQPTDQTNIIQPGQAASATTFTVGVSASGPRAADVAYQWERNVGGTWKVIGGATGASYAISPTLADNGAQFRVEVFVPGAEAISQVATLTVAQPNTAPRFTAGPDQTVAEDSGPQSVPWATGIIPHSIVRTPVNYANNFNSGAAGMELAGIPIATIGDGVLKLTTPVNSAYGAASIAIPAPVNFETINVTWKSLIGGGADGADGYSLNISDDLVADPGYGGEDGTGNGLRLTVDTFDNGGGEDGIGLVWRGTQVAFQHITKNDSGDGIYLRKNAFVDASASISASGEARFTYDGQTIVAQLPNYTGLRANRALFWGRTGGANDNHWIDDFSFNGFPFDSSSVENGQIVHFNVSNDNPSLFSVQPAISPTGVLTYTPAPNANGVAVVTVVAQDNGGTAFGGSDSSAAVVFRINVTPVNDCPTLAGQSLSVDVGVPKAFQLVGADVDANSVLTYNVVAPPAHGTVTLNQQTGAGTYAPAAGYTGPDSFTVTVSDGTCTSPAALIAVTIRGGGQCPTAVAKIEPNAQIMPGQTETVVISVNNSNACFHLDGTASSDPDGDTLTYSWVVVHSDGTTVPLATGASATACLDLGSYKIRLIVDDGTCSRSADLELEIITASEAVDVLIDKINGSNVGKNKRPFIASLKGAGASFERGSCDSARGQLGAFVNKVRAQVARTDPALAAELIRIANAILAQIECPE